MRAGIFALVLVIGLAASSWAQDGLRSASLPEQPLSSTRRALREDGFRARPDTYRPDPNRVLLPGFGYFGPQLLYPYLPPIIVLAVAPETVTEARVAPPPVVPAPVPPPAPYVAGMPGRPKTFYVIPGCYAGDRRPEPESLAPGCSVSRLRIIRPS